MYTNVYGVSELASDLRVISAETPDAWELVEQVRPLAEWVARHPERWLLSNRYECDPEQGFGLNILHREPDNSMAVCAVAWSPGGYSHPHDHHSWEVVATVIGEIRNICWSRFDEEAAPGRIGIRRGCDFMIRAGEAASFMPDEIHNLANEGNDMGLSLHIYGRAPDAVERLRFDPDSGREEQFVRDGR